jgi:hypothetical protein
MPNKTGKLQHGIGADTPEYSAWVNMRQRCLNPKNKRFKDYGGRGITICPQWDDFMCFLLDVGPRPSSQHSLDREKNDGNYEPGNVRWSIPTVQSRNTRRNQLITIGGETLCVTDWAKRAEIHYSAIIKRLKKGASPLEAVFTPSLRKKGYAEQ